MILIYLLELVCAVIYIYKEYLFVNDPGFQHLESKAGVYQS